MVFKNAVKVQNPNHTSSYQCDSIILFKKGEALIRKSRG